MVKRRLAKYDLVECIVVGHMPYGLTVKLDDGLAGFVDSGYVGDWSSGSGDWPRVGESVDCVVLGVTRDGRFRATARKCDVDLVRSVSDPQAALSNWIALRNMDRVGAHDKVDFVASRDAVAVIRWALRQSSSSPDRIRAVELFGDEVQLVKSQYCSRLYPDWK